MAITAKMVMDLREKTGLPMMECKKALEETNGDFEGAVEVLRKKGMAQLTKRAGRETGEGRVACYQTPDGQRAAAVEVLCETAPVTKTDDVIKLANAAARAAATLGDPAPEAVLEAPLPDQPGRKVIDLLHDAVNRIRENIKLGRVAVVSGHTAYYQHHDARTAVLVEFSGPLPPAVAADVCMHVAAMRPQCTCRAEVDPQQVAAERKIAAEQVQGKPANMVEKIVEGKLNRWFSEIVLLEQPFVKEEKKSVGQILKEAAPDLTVKRFVRIQVGEA